MPSAKFPPKSYLIPCAPKDRTLSTPTAVFPPFFRRFCKYPKKNAQKVVLSAYLCYTEKKLNNKEVIIVVEKKERLTISLSKIVLEELERLAKEKGLSKSALLTVAFDEYLKKSQKK